MRPHCGVLLVLALAAGAELPGKSFRVEKFDVLVQIQPDASLLVTETQLFAFTGGPFTHVHRELSAANTDGITVVAAARDGQPVKEGAGLEIVRPRSPIVRWRFEPVYDARHEFTLTYRVLGALRKEGGRDLLVWTAIPRNRTYRIMEASVEVRYPPGMTPTREPSIPGARVEWKQGEGSAVASLRSIPGERAVTLSVGFPYGTLLSTPPTWQRRDEERDHHLAEAAPAGLLAAAAALALGLLWALRVRGPRSPVAGPSGQPTAAAGGPPSALPPAIAGRLAYGVSSPAGPLIQATLFDLARRGVLRIEQGEKRRFGGPEFLVHRQMEGGEGAAHERSLLETLFGGKGSGGRPVRLSQFAGAVAKGGGAFEAALRSDMFAAGLLDRERLGRRTRAVSAGGALVALGLILAVIGSVALAALLRSAEWNGLPLATAAVGTGAGLLMAGLGGIVAAFNVSPLTGAGEMAAWPWKGFARYLADITRGRHPHCDGAIFDLYLPYAAAFGLAAPWASFFKRRGGTPIPEWLRLTQEAADGGEAAVMVACITASTAGTDASCAASVAGASGGGSSGAG